MVLWLALSPAAAATERDVSPGPAVSHESAVKKLMKNHSPSPPSGTSPWPACRPAEHLAEGQLAGFGGAAALQRRHGPHLLQTIGADGQAGGQGDRGACLLCPSPHVFGSSVGEHAEGSGAGAGGCQSRKTGLSPYRPRRSRSGPKAQAIPQGTGGALFCLTAGKPSQDPEGCSPTDGAETGHAARRAVDSRSFPPRPD